jgi:aryl-alcohol dehydrogenase-like predicted oxidoreductase
MKKRKLGWTDLELTTIGLGTWAMGGGDWSFSWGPQDDEESKAAILHALDKGVNWIDTAPAYGLGHAEEVVSEAVKGLAQKPIIATKCGISWTEERKTVRELKKGNIGREVDESLRRLGVEVIDLYQIHWPEPDAAIEQAWQEIADAIKAGKVRYAGVCNFSAEQLKRIQPIHPVASLQPPYSMIERGVEDVGLLYYCGRNNIGVIPYSPMQKGLLSGKFSRKRVEELPADDHRLRDPNFQEPRLSANLALADGLEPIARKHGKTVAQVSLAWVLRRPEVTAAIAGARRPSQIEETVVAGDWELPREDIAAIDSLIDKHRKAIEQS